MAATDLENSIAPCSDTTIPDGILPGLTGLNLNILYAFDMNMIENVVETISDFITKEHSEVTNVQKTMIALLKTKIPRKRTDARLELEQILKDSPTNLNALADLETLYRDLNRTNEADRCRFTIDKHLKGETAEDIQIKRTCLLEQGYAILIEKNIVNENTVELRISDLHKILTTEHEHSEGKRHKCLARGIMHLKKLLINIKEANKENTYNRQVINRRSSLDKFELAENLTPVPFSHPVWNYYYAKALNQYYDSLNQIVQDQQDMRKEMTEVTLKAVSKFWNFVQLPPDAELERFKARSLAHIGQIIVETRRKDIIQSNEDKLDFIKQPEFHEYFNDPFQAIKRAYNMGSKDVIVLNSCGRSLRRLSFMTKNKNEKIKYLEQADNIFTESIGSSDLNWYAHSTRMEIRLHLANTCINEDREKAKSYLENAEKDGRICFNSKNTRRDMCKLAEVCQKLSKFPDVKKYGPEFVKPSSKNYLHKALDYLFYATHLGNSADFYWTNRISSCLFDLGEYEQAIDWQRKTWLISSLDKSMSFRILCKYMLTRFHRDHKMKSKPAKIAFLREFLYLLIFAEERYKDISSDIENLYRSKRKELLLLLNDVIVTKTVSISDDEKIVISSCLDSLIRVADGTEQQLFQGLKDSLSDLNPLKNNEYLLSDIFKNDASLKAPDTLAMAWSEGFKYDFFVSHSHKDGSWVSNILLRQLEGTLDENDIALKGCIADRDFIPGMHVVDNIIEAIKQSNKVILILTPHFVSSNWCHYEANHAIYESLDLDRKNNRNFVIPIVLKDCEIPKKLACLNFVDMTSQGNLMREILRLKKAFLPEDE